MALYIIFYIKEESSKAKLLQFVSGVKVWTFWISTILVDLVIYLLSIALMSGIITAFSNPGWKTGEDIGRTFILFACFGFATLPLIYLFAMTNKDSANGFNNISMIGFGMGEEYKRRELTGIVLNFHLSLHFSYSVCAKSPTEARHCGHEGSGEWNGLDFHCDTVLQSRPLTLPCEHHERGDQCNCSSALIN